MDLITLRSADTALSLAPAAGGSIARYWLTRGERTIDWLRPAPADSGRNPLVMGSFPLVPYSGRIRDGRFAFGRRRVTLPLNFLPEKHSIHGQSWQMPWKVLREDPTHAELEYEYAAGAWPWTYRARQSFTLEGDNLLLGMTLTNESKSPMPAGFGPHPYFRRTPQAKLTAGIQKVWLNDREVMPTELVVPPAERDLRRGIAVDGIAMDNCFAGWDGMATIEWPEWPAQLVMRAEPPLRFLVVYTPPGADFFCVEPVSHCADAVNYATAGRTDTGLQVLEPGDTLAATVQFEPRLRAGNAP